MEDKYILLAGGLAVVLLAYITFIVFYIKNALLQNSKSVQEELDKKITGLGDTLKRQGEDTVKRLLEDSNAKQGQLTQAILENKEGILGNLVDGFAGTHAAVEGAAQNGREILKLLKAVHESNLKQDEILKNLILAYQSQGKSVDGMVGKLLESNRVFSDKVDLVYKDFDLMVEMLKAVWMSDLIKDIQNNLK